MSLDVYGEAYNQGYGGCLVVVYWLVSGPVAYATAESLLDALQTGVIEGSYRGDAWQFALNSDPTGYHIAFWAMVVLCLGSATYFLFGVYKIIKFFVSLPLS